MSTQETNSLERRFIKFLNSTSPEFRDRIGALGPSVGATIVRFADCNLDPWFMDEDGLLDVRPSFLLTIAYNLSRLAWEHPEDFTATVQWWRANREEFEEMSDCI